MEKSQHSGKISTGEIPKEIVEKLLKKWEEAEKTMDGKIIDASKDNE